MPINNCNQCGDCCRDITLPLGMIFDDDDVRWIKYHGIEIIEKDGRQWVKINNPCSKLINNKCSIYENRPFNCKVFFCSKVIKS